MVRPVREAIRRLTRSFRWAVLLSVLLLSACGVPAPAANSAASRPADRLDVFAAASLSEAFDEIGRAFAAREPAVEVRFNYAGSQALAQQINSGAPADAFASADQRQMEAVISNGRIESDGVSAFARNRLVIVVPADNPAGIESVADLAQPGLALVLAAEEVPIGAYSRQLIRSAVDRAENGPDYEQQVLANVVSLEENVRAVLTKVALGEADAGIVYASDAARDQAVRWIEIPADLNINASYYLAVIEESPDQALAARFVDFVLGEEGQSILSDYGFESGGN